MESSDRNNKKRLKFKDRMKMLHLDEEMFETIPEEELAVENGTSDALIGTSKQPSNAEVSDSVDKTNKRDRKKSEQASTQGKVLNTGTGKEWDRATELEYKNSIMGQDTEPLPLKDFSRIYNEDRASNPGMSPRLFRRENADFITYKFKSTDFVFITRIDKSLEEDNRVLLMNLAGNVYNL